MSADECRPVEMDAESREMFTDVVRAAKRRLAAETGLVWGDIAASVSCTYRQFDVWATAGLIHATGATGSGNVRTITRAEITVLAIMADLVAAGVIPRAAAGLARQLAEVDVASMGKFCVSRAEAQC